MKTKPKIKLTDREVVGELNIPPTFIALVIFVSGTSRGNSSPENHKVAELLYQQGIATFLFDLIDTGNQEFSLPELEAFAIRIQNISLDLSNHYLLAGTPIFYFGSSMGAAIAVIASTFLKNIKIKGIISFNGILEYTKAYLQEISYPILLIVQRDNWKAIENNEDYFKLIESPKSLLIIDGSEHLLEETRLLEKIGEETMTWINYILVPPKYLYLL